MSKYLVMSVNSPALVAKPNYGVLFLGGYSMELFDQLLEWVGNNVAKSMPPFLSDTFRVSSFNIEISWLQNLDVLALSDKELTKLKELDHAWYTIVESNVDVAAVEDADNNFEIDTQRLNVNVAGDALFSAMMGDVSINTGWFSLGLVKEALCPKSI